MTPMEIEVALRFHYDLLANGHFHGHPGYQNAITNLITYGLLERTPGGWVEPIDDRLKVYIEALRTVPLPVKGWIMP